MKIDKVKANGVHYTPWKLAQFLASVTLKRLPSRRGTIRVLDPSCGDGVLLQAVVDSFPSRSRRRLKLTGYETDKAAIKIAQKRLADAGIREFNLAPQDFLELEGVESDLSDKNTLFDMGGDESEKYDVVIANPPYVRTQVLGSQKSRELARRFGLTGRVDLYQAFTKAMANVLKPGGILGLLTSNRFLSIKAGESLRQLLRSTFDLKAIYDLGDTKLFAAAVLPVIVIATKRNGSRIEERCIFDRVYESRPNSSAIEYSHVLEALTDRDSEGSVKTSNGHFCIERGVLSDVKNPRDVWTLSTPEYDEWLRRVRLRQDCTIEDVASVRVGIKTTADGVFVRNDWKTLPTSQRPESELLFPLITHHEAARWIALESEKPREVCYPHVMLGGKRVPIDLGAYKRTRAYFETHEERLRRRKYVRDSGRKWYEIWVPHKPSDWAKPKVVFPDISEHPRFFYDDTGAIIQGDCYWITTKPEANPDWLFLILAVANSTFITRFYDIAFHNKLYSGRRRFMTQYVKKFPLPQLDTEVASEIVRLTKQLVKQKASVSTTEEKLNELTWQAFEK